MYHLVGVWEIVDACLSHGVKLSEHIAEKYLKLLKTGNIVTIPGGARLVPVGIHFRVEPYAREAPDG